MVKIRSVTAEIFLIWTNFAWTSVAWTNVILTVGPRSLPLKFGQKRTKNSWDPSGRFWWACCYSSSSPSSCYRGKTKSSDFSLGLGLEFDKNEENAKNKDEPKNKDNLKNPIKNRCFDYTIKNWVPSKKGNLLLFIYCMARLLLL